MQNEIHSEKNTPKGFCWAVWQFGKPAESLTFDSFHSYKNKGGFKLLLYEPCGIWSQTGTKLDLKSKVVLMLLWIGEAFGG